MVTEIRIEYSKCTKCKKCIEMCTFSVLEWFEENPIVVNPHNCSACLECQSNCPVEAISIKEK
jgi:MinD superfamily P-loop ATPase